MIRVAICDSQITTAEKIKDILETIYHGGIGITVCESNFALQNYVLDEMRGDVDILFLGIQLPDSSGILSAVEIQKSYPNIQIAFVAEDGKAAQEIFSANPSYFLMKPIEKDKIQDAMNRMVVNIHKNSRQVLTFESKKGVYAFPMDEILYIESDRRELVFVMTGNRRESGYGKLDDLMQKLPPQFLRCHQSYIVNMDKLSFFSGREMVLLNQMRVPISRPRYKEVRGRALEYLNNSVNSVNAILDAKNDVSDTVCSN